MNPESGLSPLTHTGIVLSQPERTCVPLKTGSGIFAPGKSSVNKDTDAEKARLLKASQGFEAIFLRKLLSTMRSTMSENSMFGTGPAGEIYGDIIDYAVAEAMAKKSVLGLADQLYDTLVKRIEKTADAEKNAVSKPIFLKIPR